MPEEIKRLEFPLTRKGITYALVSETEYTRTVKASFPGSADWYEIFEKRINAARTIAGCILPASEAFPHDEAFGKWAWTYPTEAQCQAISGELDSKVAGRIHRKQVQVALEATTAGSPVPTHHLDAGRA